MGKQLVNQFRGINPQAKRGALLFLAFLVSFACLAVPRAAQAAVARDIAWTRVINDTTTRAVGAAVNLSGNFTVTTASGLNRIMLVAITQHNTANSAPAVPSTISYGGVTLSLATSNRGTSARQHTWIYYLRDNAVMDGTARPVAVSWSGGLASRKIDVFAAVYTGVDQSVALTVGNRMGNTANTTAMSLSAAMTVNPNWQAVYVINNVVGTLNGVPATWTNNVNWRTPNSLYAPTDISGAAATTYGYHIQFAERAIPATGTTDNAVTSAKNVASRYAMSAVVLPPVSPGIANGTTMPVNTDVWANDLNKVVDAFSVTGGGTITGLTITTSASTTPVNVSAVKIYRKGDANTTVYTPVVDTQVGSGTASTPTISITGMSEPVVPGTNYIITYDIASGAIANGTSTTLTGRVTAIAPAGGAVNDTAGGTLIVLPTTSINDATEPSAARLKNSSAATLLNAFSVRHTGQSPTDDDTVTEVTVTLTPTTISGGTAATLSKIRKVEIVDSTNTIVYGSMTAAITGDTWNIPLNPVFTITSTPVTYYVRISTANSIIPSNNDSSCVGSPTACTGYYAVQGTITGFMHTLSNNKPVITDSSSQTIAIDFEEPGDASAFTAVPPGVSDPNGTLNLTWSQATDPHGGSLGAVSYKIMRGAANGGVPNPHCIDGTDISTAGATINYGAGTATDVGLVSSQATQYKYRICAIDSLGNISHGVTTYGIAKVVSSCNNPPQLRLSPTSQIIKSAGTVYALNISNMDTGVCSDVQFDLAIVSEGGTNPAHFVKTIPGVPLGQGKPANTATVGTGGVGHANTGANALITVAANTVDPNKPAQLETYSFSLQVSSPGDSHGPPITVGPVTGLLNDMPPIVHNSANMNKFTYGGWGQTYTCSTCHSNSTTNIKGIFTFISTPIGKRPVTFTKTSSAVTDYDGVFSNDQRPVKNVSNNVCSVCHHRTRQHQYSANKVGNVVGPNGTEAYNPNHNNSRDCVACHTHNTAFKPAGGTCGECHGDNTTNYAPISRLTMVKENTNALGPYTSAWGAHKRHNTVRIGCGACHTNSNHAFVSTGWLGDGKLHMGFRVDNNTFNGFNSDPAQAVNGGSFWGTSNLNYPFEWVAAPTVPPTVVNSINDYNNSCMTYCHGNWNGNAGNGSQQQPIWIGGGVEVVCGSCHYASDTTPPTGGSHNRHVSSTGNGLSIPCYKCHAPTALANFTGAAHINGMVQWNLSTLKGGVGGAKYKGFRSGQTAERAGETAYGQCSNLYCHSSVQSGNGTGAPASYATPLWGGTVTCGDCHAQPNQTGSHAQHEGFTDAGIAFDCHVCHNNGGDTAPSNHANGYVNFEFNGLGANTQYSLGTNIPVGTAFGKCNNSNCHGRFERSWGTTSSGITLCEKCHGSATSAGGFYGTKGPGSAVFYNESGVGMHDIHIQNPNTPRKATFASFTSFAMGFRCNQCHYNPKSPFSSGHVDTALPAESGFDHMSSISHSGDVFGYYSAATFNPVTKTCNNVWCHGAGMNSNRSNGPYAGTTPPGRIITKWNVPQLTGNRFSDCNTCHAVPPPAPGPGYTHYGKTYAQCNECHRHVSPNPSGLVTGLTFDDKSMHVNGTVDGGCGGCHGNPPITSDISNPANSNNTGLAFPAQAALPSGVAGAHNTHMLVPAIGQNCSFCHNNSDAAMPSNKLEIGFRIFSSVDGAAKNGTFVGYSGPLGNPHWASSRAGTTRGVSAVQDVTCSNVYCHGGGSTDPFRPALPNAANQTPNWTGTVSCGDCHGADPISRPKFGSHSTHVATIAAVTCETCHGLIPDNGSHVDGKVSWSLDHTNPSVGTLGTYNNWTSGTLAGLAPRKNQTDYRSCNNIYCHSSVQSTTGSGFSGVTYGSPTWGNNGSLNCGSCHKNAATDLTAPGSHVKHANTSNGNLALSCGICHHDGGFGTTLHADNAVYVNFSISIGGKYNAYSSLPGKPAGLAVYQSCSNTSCHGATSPAWGTPGPMLCNSCHSAKANDAFFAANSRHNNHYEENFLPSSYSNSSTSVNLSSAGAYRFACGACHDPRRAKHSKGVYSTNAAAEVFFGFSGNRRGTYTYGTTQGSLDNGLEWTNGNNCQTTYCHSDGRGGLPKITAFTWAQADTNNCAFCHDSKSITATASTLSGKHDKHMNHTNNGMIGTNNGFNCLDCHAQTITNTDNTTLGNKRNHVNMVANYSGAKANKGFNSVTKECNNIYCHSNGNPRALVYVNMTGTRIWTGTKSITTCNNCHGRGNALGYPDYANIGPNDPKSNLHQGHLAGAAAGNTTDCADCHRKTPDGTVQNKFRNYSSQHMNGSPNVYFNTTKAYVGTKATVTQNVNLVSCSTVVCHGQAGTAVLIWGGAKSGSGLPTVRTCTKCHGDAATAYTNYTAAQIAPGYNNSGTDTTMVNTAGSLPRVGVHQQHLKDNVMSGPVKCGDCHITLSGGTDAAAMRSASHWNMSTATITFSVKAKVNSNIPVVSRVGGIMQCSNVYCHKGWATSGTTGTTTTPFWNNTGMIKASANTVGACVACHAMPPSWVSGHPAALSNAAALSTIVASCGGCHPNVSGTTTNVSNAFTTKSQHINGIKEANGHSIPNPGSSHMATAGTTPWATCTGCHTNGTNQTFPTVPLGLAPDCTGCHKRPSNEGTFGLKTPVGTSSCYDCHGRTAGAVANYSSARPNGSMFPNYSGSHTKHVVTQAIACSSCHYGAGTGSPKHGFSNHTAHDYKFVNVSSSNRAFAFTWSGGQGKGTCSTNVCHGNAEWGVTKLQCNSCHSYDSTDSWTSSSSYTYTAESVGAHKKHINYIKARLNVTLNPATDKFDTTNPVCKVCHDMTLASNHSMSKSTNVRSIVMTGRNFGGAATYNGDNTTSSLTKPKSCSNTDCHYRTSPIWSTY